METYCYLFRTKAPLQGLLSMTYYLGILMNKDCLLDYTRFQKLFSQ